MRFVVSWMKHSSDWMDDNPAKTEIVLIIMYIVYLLFVGIENY